VSDWQVGDLAVCVVVGDVHCVRCRHRGNGSPQDALARKVVAVRLSIMTRGPNAGTPCGCVTLDLDDGSMGVVQRFRKVISDKHEPCEAEFVTLLNRTKRKVPTIASQHQEQS
jgi:hypothetical protein